MQFSSLHTHTLFCDGRDDVETMCRAAFAKGLVSVGFSAHGSVYRKTGIKTDWNLDDDRVGEYLDEVRAARLRWKGKIAVYLGLEVDYIPGVASVKDEAVQNEKWDYLIGSIHHVKQFPDGDFWNIDGSFNTFKKGLDSIFSGDIFAAVSTFYRYTCEMIELGGFDIIGHLDKIALNGRQIPGFDLSDKWYDDLIQETFQLLAEKEIIVEINTKSFYQYKIVFPDIRYFKQLRRLNIPVMVNSDCHYPDKITDGFPEMYKLLQEAGFETVRVLRKGNWRDIPVN